MPPGSRSFPSVRRRRALLRTARSAALETGRYVVRQIARGGRTVRRKGKGDFVTAVDDDAEARLRRQLLGAHPDLGFLGEEAGGIDLDASCLWVVDPIDGTSNFARGLLPFGVSVAALCSGQPIAAAVFDARDDSVYSAALGLGAFHGRRRLRAGRGRLDDGSMVGVQWLRGAAELDFAVALAQLGGRLRNFGCTVAQLCDVAAGRLDGSVQEQGKIWDIAAAGLLVVEAGGSFTDWRGAPLFPFPDLDRQRDYPSVAAFGRAHRALLDRLRPALAAQSFRIRNARAPRGGAAGPGKRRPKR